MAQSDCDVCADLECGAMVADRVLYQTTVLRLLCALNSGGLSSEVRGVPVVAPSVTHTLRSGVNSNVSAGLKKVLITKVGDSGTVNITTEDGVYSLTGHGETVSFDVAGVNAVLPAIILKSVGGAMWKWIGMS